jgi:hypothetical protein
MITASYELNAAGGVSTPEHLRNVIFDSPTADTELTGGLLSVVSSRSEQQDVNLADGEMLASAWT